MKCPKPRKYHLTILKLHVICKVFLSISQTKFRSALILQGKGRKEMYYRVLRLNQICHYIKILTTTVLKKSNIQKETTTNFLLNLANQQIEHNYKSNIIGRTPL